MSGTREILFNIKDYGAVGDGANDLRTCTEQVHVRDGARIESVALNGNLERRR